MWMMRSLAIIALGMLWIGSAQTASNGVLNTGNRIAPTRDLSGVELKVLENQQRMLRHQQEHQRFMEDLRRAPSPEQQRPEVPKMQRNCQMQVYGNKWLKNCR